MLQITSYDLFLDLEFNVLTFTGRVLIEVEATEELAFHAHGLTLTSVTVNGKSFHFEQKDDAITVKTGSIKGVVKIEYAGTIRDTLVGIYRAPYNNMYMITTHFEASNARRMFPCYDHPRYKAEFKLAVQIDGDLDAISNMPIKSVQKANDKKIVTFHTTPKMSTYLLYLGVGKFDEVVDQLGETELIVATPPGEASKGAFALDVAKRAMVFYQSYFGIPYVLPKLHLVMVPEFAAGAMENWGAITFRETAIYADENSAIKTKKRVSEVVAHELAHMWFGDLVTMKWWDDVWLNESFATFMAFKAVDAIQPEWRIWQDFLKLETSGALARDGLRSTHPIEVAVTSPSEIEQIFDEISYGKGASILRMIEGYMGAKAFKKGVEIYLNRHKYSNAEGHDFWKSLEATYGERVSGVVSKWIKKPGYPIVTVSRNGGTLVLKQERFLLSGASEKTTWPIPIVMKVNGESKKLLLEKEEQTIDVKRVESLNINVDHSGFYRVYYDGLYDLVWKNDLSSFDKWGIASDAFAFLVAGKLSFTDYLKVIMRYFREQDYLPALEVSDQLAFLYTVSPSRIAEVSKGFHRSQLRILEGKTDENSLMLRGVVAGRLGMLDEDYARTLGSQFHDYRRVEPNMKGAVAVAFARAYNDFEGIVKKYRKSGSDEERVRLLDAMMSFKDPTLIALSLGLALSGEVKRQDLGTMILSVVGNPDAREVTWTWLKVNIGRLERVFEGTGTLSRVFSSAIPLIGIGNATEVEQFFMENRILDAEKGIEAGLERLKIYNELIIKLKIDSGLTLSE